MRDTVPTTWAGLAAWNRELAATLTDGAALLHRAADARTRLARTARTARLWSWLAVAGCLALAVADALAPACVALVGALAFGRVAVACDAAAARCLTMAARASAEARECASRAAECLAWGRVRREP